MFDHEVSAAKVPLDAVTIRRAAPGDAPALALLAVLDSARPLAGDLLLAEVEGEPWAALSLDDGRVVSDPFRPAAAARALLLLRARHLAAAAGGAGQRHPARALAGGLARAVARTPAARAVRGG